MRIEGSVTAISWIPSEAIEGLPKLPFELGVGHYDDPPPDRLSPGDLERLRDADRFREANLLTAWIDVEDDAIVDAGYADVVRPHTPGPGVYTYWDYTQLRFPRREGMRIDFVLGSPSFEKRVTSALIDREERKGKGASDHAPVIVDLAD